MLNMQKLREVCIALFEIFFVPDLSNLRKGTHPVMWRFIMVIAALSGLCGLMIIAVMVLP